MFGVLFNIGKMATQKQIKLSWAGDASNQTRERFYFTIYYSDDNAKWAIFQTSVWME